MAKRVLTWLRGLFELVGAIQILGSIGGATVLAILTPTIAKVVLDLPVILSTTLGVGVFFASLAIIFAILKAVTERWFSNKSKAATEPRSEDTQPNSSNLQNSLQQNLSANQGTQSWPPANDSELSGSYINGRSLYIFDLRRQNWMVRNKTFENCFVRGPAVVAVLASTDFVNCSFAEGGDRNSLVWPVAPGRADHIGAIGLQGCIFRNCTFLRVGLLDNIVDNGQPTSSQ